MTYGDVNWPVFKALTWIFVIGGIVYLFKLIHDGAPRAYINEYCRVLMILSILIILVGSILIAGYNERRYQNEDIWNRRLKAIDRQWERMNRNH